MGTPNDHLMVFGCRSHPSLAEGICQEIGCELGGIDIFEYGNDNTFVRVLENVREADVFVVQTARRPVNHMTMELSMRFGGHRLLVLQQLFRTFPICGRTRKTSHECPSQHDWLLICLPQPEPIVC